MECPNCKKTKLLAKYLSRQLVEVDYCPKCAGMWLDQGEILNFCKNKKRVYKNFHTAISNKIAIDKLSPRTGKKMWELNYAGKVKIDFCQETGGLWFDSSELRNIMEVEKGMDFTERVNNPSKQEEQKAIQKKIKDGVKLQSLPNLHFR